MEFETNGSRMTNTLKPGDRVTVNGEEYEITAVYAAGFRAEPLPQKSELEKFVDARWSEFEIDEEVTVRTAKNDAYKTAFALLEHLEKNLDSCLTSYQLLTVASKWCGK